MVKTKSENVLGKMILTRIQKFNWLINEANKLNQSDKRYRSTKARIIEDIYEVSSQLREIEDEYNLATDDAYIEKVDVYLYNDIEDSGYDLDDEEFLDIMDLVDFKKYMSFIKKRLKTKKK